MDRSDVKVFTYVSVAVIAGSSLPRDTSFGPISDLDIRHMDVTDESVENSKVIKIFSSEGYLVSQDQTTDWIHCLRASRDVYEQTLEMYRSGENKIYIRTTRDVVKGEILSVWYDEAYGREKGVPYLTLSNIRGIQHYQCTRCSKAFAYPNTLKLHIMRGCDSVTHCVHQRLYQSPTSFSEIGEKCRFANNHPVYKDRSCCITKTVIPEVCDLQKSQFCRLRRPVPENVRPLASINCRVSYGAENVFTPYTLKASVAILPPVSNEERLFDNDCKRYGHVKSPYVQNCSKNVNVCSESEEEPIDILHRSFIEFSTKSGHRCVYCGKFYSRKYGLKIHLRTHTGYKPLKCKICLRAFGDPSNLNKHTRLHSEGDTPYKCVHCGKILVRRRDLLRHLNSRHPGYNAHETDRGDRGNTMNAVD